MSPILIANFLVYTGYFIYNLKSKASGKSYAFLVLGIFALSSLFSIFYYDSDLYYTLTEATHGISPIALLYLFIGFLILTYPLRTYKKIDTINVPKIGRQNAITIIFIILGILSIVPFFENLHRAIEMSGQNMADVYFDRQGTTMDTRSHLSTIGRFCNGVITWFQYFVPVGFFYFIQQKKKWYWIVLVGLGALNPVLQGIIFGGRGALFQSFCVFIFNYIVFYNSFSKKTKKIITYIGIGILSIFVIVLITMTLARAGGESDIALQGIYRYIGEGFVNFGETGWYVTRHTDGYIIFNGTGYTFLKYVSPYFDARDYVALGNHMGIRMYVYYTVMGDAFLDFNVIGGLVFLFLLAAIFKFSTKRTYNNFSSIVLLNLYAKIGFNGIYCWAYMYSLDYILFTLIVIIVLRLFERRGNIVKLRIINK